METSSQRETAKPQPGQEMLNAHAKAEQGDPDAQFFLGVHYSSAPGALQDLVQSAQWYRRAADQNHVLAQFNLAIIHAHGQGMVADDGVAAEWMRKAAEGGDAGAQFNMGTRCHRAAVNRSEVDAKTQRIESFKWFQLAADQGYEHSLEFRDRLTNDMTREEVGEASSRVRQFVVR